MRKKPSPTWRTASLLLFFCLSVSSLSGCGEVRQRYSDTYYDMFDTYVTVVGYENSTDAFYENCEAVREELYECSVLFDIYREYDRENNLCTVNRSAGKAPVPVDGRVLDLCEYAIDLYRLTDGKLNIAMGSVLRLWHDCREAAAQDPDSASLPSEDSLTEAARHTDIEDVVCDREASTLFLRDAEMSLDVGAVAKGYAADRAAALLRERGVTDGYAVDVGGNIITIGEKLKGECWTAAIRDPYSEYGGNFIASFGIRDASLVTSGTYERYYEVDGVRYHHIIDPATNAPARGFDSVSVFGAPSVLCDALSTALFCMTQEEGMALVTQTDGVEALWVKDGVVTRSPGFPE